MRRLSATIARLSAAKNAMSAAIANDDGRLSDLTGFGSNPGALAARMYLPDGLASGAPLVVVLHGCTQSAAAYDRGSGWSELADRCGFALLYPEQRRANNPNLCFNWFTSGDARRCKGEALSIRQMIEHMVATHDLDPEWVFVTGLSAGGAMTAVMLAAYPEIFAGGAIIAGLPFATADTLPDALQRMRGQGEPSRRDLAARARNAAPDTQRVPRLSVWHGTQDTIVDPANADAIIDQWRDLHGLGDTNGAVEQVDGHRREVWRDAKGRDIIEKYDVNGMGHGAPLDTGSGTGCGTAGPHMLSTGICSTTRIAEFWGLVKADAVRREPSRPQPAIALIPERPAAAAARTVDRSGASGVGAVIEDALRAAGLMR